MILSVEVLNQLENKLSPHGLGVEIITESELTYNKVLTAVNNNYLPLIKIPFNLNGFIYDTIYYMSTESGYYEISTAQCTYSATSANEIMEKVAIA